MNRLIIVSSLLLAPCVDVRTGRPRPGGYFQAARRSNGPAYSGDYTGKRYSSLKHINQSTVKNLSLSWVTRFTPVRPSGAGDGGGRRIRRGRRGAPAPIIVGGLGKGDLKPAAPRLGGGILWWMA